MTTTTTTTTPTKLVTFSYRTHAGRVSMRRVRPIRLRFGTTAWHPVPQWLLTAYDLDRQADRDFALANMQGGWSSADAVASTPALPVVQLGLPIDLRPRDTAAPARVTLEPEGTLLTSPLQHLKELAQDEADTWNEDMVVLLAGYTIRHGDGSTSAGRSNCIRRASSCTEEELQEAHCRIKPTVHEAQENHHH